MATRCCQGVDIRLVELFQKRRDRAFILVTHDADVIRLYCQRACVLHGGRLFEFDTVDAAYAFYESQPAPAPAPVSA